MCEHTNNLNYKQNKCKQFYRAYKVYSPPTNPTFLHSNVFIFRACTESAATCFSRYRPSWERTESLTLSRRISARTKSSNFKNRPNWWRTSRADWNFKDSQGICCLLIHIVLLVWALQQFQFKTAHFILSNLTFFYVLIYI